jgi:hypothetical protein
MGNAYTRPQTHMHQDSDAANAQLQISEEAGMLYDPTAKHMAVTTAATCCYPDKVVYRHASAPLRTRVLGWVHTSVTTEV